MYAWVALLAWALVFGWSAGVAAQSLSGCGTSSAATSAIRSGFYGCYDFTGSTDSGVFHVAATRAYVDFDPDTAGVAGAATVYLVRCTSPTYSANSCFRKLTDQDQLPGLDDLPLNGDELTNRRRMVLEPGWWMVDVRTSAGGATARVLITGGF